MILINGKNLCTQNVGEQIAKAILSPDFRDQLKSYFELKMKIKKSKPKPKP